MFDRWRLARVEFGAYLLEIYRVQERLIGKDVKLEFSADGVNWSTVGVSTMTFEFPDGVTIGPVEPFKGIIPPALKKHFPNKASLDEFLSELGPLAYQKVSYSGDLITLQWRTLKLFCVNTDGEWFRPGIRYEVKRETQGHYLIRCDKGLVRSVDRQTMLAYGGRFEIEEAA